MLHILKKFFIDDPIARTKKIYFWCFQFLGLRFSFLYVPFYYLYVRRLLCLGKDGRVGMMQIDSVIVRGCNLRCQYCTVYSPYRKGLIPADELIASYTAWRKKIKPQYFILIGGEPLLHPDLARIVRESARIWNDSKLWLTTNGLQLDRIKPEVMQAIKETGYKIIVSEHTFEPEHRERLEAGYVRLREAKIPFVVKPSRVAWVAIHEHNEKGEIIPYQSEPEKAWNHCAFRACVTIAGDQLYRCGHLLYVAHAVQEGVLNGNQWKAALTYQPLTLQSTPEEIAEHLRRRVIPECAVCPDKRKMVSAQQLPLPKQDSTE